MATSQQSTSNAAPLPFINAINVFNFLQSVSYPLIVDVRSTEDFDSARISRAISFPLSEATENVNSEDRAESLIRDRIQRENWKKRSSYSTVVLYDERSVANNVTTLLRKAYWIATSGYKHQNVVLLDGGFDGFLQACRFFCEGNSVRLGPKTICTPRKFPSQILEFLYLGKYDHARELQVLKQLGITHVLNVTDDCENKFQSSRDIDLVYLQISVRDEKDVFLKRYFESAVEFIEQARVANGKVLVHCAMGKSRSATIVIAYLMKTRRWPVEEAKAFVAASRPIISPNDGFMNQLRQYEIEVVYTD